MGMNIYIKTKNGKEGKHIGKRSAAGLFCYDCKVSLWNKERQKNEVACPFCGKKEVKDGYNPVMKELGFDDEHYKPTGVQGTSSFTWCIGEYGYGETVREIKSKLLKKEVVLVDEYGRDLSVSDFFKMFDYIGIERALDADFS